MSSRISGWSSLSSPKGHPKVKDGGNPLRSTTRLACRHSIAGPLTLSSQTGPSLPPEPFFSGAGIDRADVLRADPDRVAELARSAEARQLVWRDGLPAVGEEGRLEWQDVTTPDLFLGIDQGRPHFSATEQPHSNARAAFDTMGTLAPSEAPLFAAALSLAWWHSRHRFCANCGHDSVI